MAGQLHTAAEAAGILKVRESWLKTKAATRSIQPGLTPHGLRHSHKTWT
jgi:integrase